jgi:ribosomal protein L13
MQATVQKEWLLVDAENMVLGRLAQPKLPFC